MQGDSRSFEGNVRRTGHETPHMISDSQRRKARQYALVIRVDTTLRTGILKTSLIISVYFFLIFESREKLDACLERRTGRGRL